MGQGHACSQSFLRGIRYAQEAASLLSRDDSSNPQCVPNLLLPVHKSILGGALLEVPVLVDLDWQAHKQTRGTAFRQSTVPVSDIAISIGDGFRDR